jgi:hypothetical protein
MFNLAIENVNGILGTKLFFNNCDNTQAQGFQTLLASYQKKKKKNLATLKKSHNPLNV